MARVVTLVLIFVVWALFISLVLGDLTGPIRGIFQGDEIKNANDPINPAVNEDSENLPANMKNQYKNFSPGDAVDEGTPLMEVQRGNDDNSYFVSFEEIHEPSKNGSNSVTETENRMARKTLIKPFHDKFISEMKTLRDRFYSNRSRRQGKFVQRVSDSGNGEESLEQRVNQYAIQAENVITDIYHTANSLRKQLGVGRDEVPSKFVNAGEANKTLIAIDEILTDLKFQLRNTMGCRGCYTPHPELSEYLEWLVLDNSCTLCETKSKTKENFRLYHRRMKMPIPCSKRARERPLKKQYVKNYVPAKSVQDD